MHRRNFIQQSGTLIAGTLIADSVLGQVAGPAKKRVALVGTGVRGLGMWGKPVVREFKDHVEFVGLCDINPGRVETGKSMLGVQCPTYTDLDKMLREQKPDMLLVMSVDGVHHEHIIKGLEAGADVVTEKPMTIDEKKCQAILDAEKKNGKESPCNIQLSILASSTKNI